MIAPTPRFTELTFCAQIGQPICAVIPAVAFMGFDLRECDRVGFSQFHQDLPDGQVQLDVTLAAVNTLHRFGGVFRVEANLDGGL